MEYLDVLICCSPSRYLPQLVLDHLLVQGVPLRLFFSNVKGDGAASARNFVKDMWIQNENPSKYALMTDNDLIMPRDSVQAMVTFLDENEDFGAISLHRHQIFDHIFEDKHVNAGPVLFRSSALKEITYHNEAGCECQGMTDDVKAMNLRIGYLNGFQYGHIENTERGDV